MIFSSNERFLKLTYFKLSHEPLLLLQQLLVVGFRHGVRQILDGCVHECVKRAAGQTEETLQNGQEHVVPLLQYNNNSCLLQNKSLINKLAMIKNK